LQNPLYPTIYRHVLSFRLLRLILLMASVLCTAASLRAQSLPFGDTFLPTFSFTETYKDTVVLGDFGYEQGSDGALSVSAKLSMKDVVVEDIFAEGNMLTLSVANLQFSLDFTLAEQSDASGYHLYTWSLTDIDPNTGEEIVVGTVVLKYNATEMRLAITVNHDPKTYTLYAAQEAGSDETLDDMGLILNLTVGPYGIQDTLLYVDGTATTFDKTVGTGDDQQTFYGLANVSLSGAIDSTLPTITMAYPPPPFHGVYPLLTERPVTVHGTTTDDHGVLGIEVLINDGDWVPAIFSLADWSLPDVEFKPGWNKVSVRATDQDGHVRTVERSVRFSATSNLTVKADGNAPGKVVAGFFSPLEYEPGKPSPQRKTAQRDGTRLTISAVPGPTAVFDGWTSSKPLTPEQLASPRLVFAHQPNLMLTAHFLINPFTPVKGRYNGLAAGATAEGNGFLSTTLANDGSFTGTVKVGKLVLKLKGKFSNTGRYTKTVTVAKVPYTIDLTLNVSGTGAEQITGTVTGGNVNVSIVARRATFDRLKNPAPQAGTYNVIIPPATGQSGDFPVGIGFGKVTVSAAGSVRFVGQAGTSPAFNAAAQLSADGMWPFFGSLYGGRGSISGLVTFDLQDPAHDLAGSLAWFRPPGVTNLPVYPNGFSGQSNLRGAKWTAPAAGSRVFLEASAGVGKFNVNAVADGTLPALTASLDGSLSTANLFTVTVPGNAPIQTVTMKINPLTGQLVGSFKEGTTLAKFSALIVKSKINQAAGFFRRGTRTGSVEIVAP
jgi:hypothetical protein